MDDTIDSDNLFDHLIQKERHARIKDSKPEADVDESRPT